MAGEGKEISEKSPDQGASTTDTQQVPSVEEQQRLRRRKLIKGLALCAPMVMTLRPGAALAGGSNYAGCFKEGTGVRQNFTGSPFGGYRCVHDTVDDSGVNDNTWNSYIVKDRSEFDNSSGGRDVHLTDSASSVDQTDDCLVFVDGTGSVDNVDDNATTGWGNDGTHWLVKGSCWTSLAT
ncbi:hypothetical protein [Magnetococcus sp. PR-3]|uniref:hypothetical protein n=1 Tax=Magnetococcus sp. PR-3 TaxID=3120355 RepID=UPI002FCE16F0